MNILEIDDVYSIVYDENSNPQYVKRHDHRHMNINSGTPTWIICMFYALLDAKTQIENEKQWEENDARLETSFVPET